MGYDTLPTVMVNRTTYAWVEDTDDCPSVLGESTTVETFDPEWDRIDYGTPVAWAVATLRRLAEGFEPSVYPIPDELPEHAWLSGTYDHPLYGFEATSAFVYGVTPRERAAIFRMLARPIEAQRAWHEQVLAAVTYGGPVAATYAAA